MIKAAIAPNGGHMPSDWRTLPQVRLSDLAASTLCLVLYELATNSVKYGARRSAGEVDVAWAVTAGDLVIDWRERSVLEADTSPRPGFGLSMVRSAIADILGGSAVVSADGEDLLWRIAISGQHVRRP